MERTWIGELGDRVGQDVSISGWVDVRRDQGKLVFFDFRDASGYVQGVVLPGSPAMEIAKDIRNEYVVRIAGKVNKRPEKNAQPEKQNGDIELEIMSIEVLNESEPMPYDITGDTLPVDESVRLKYRYLDLRNARMQRNIRMRDKIITFFRNYMHEHGFVEVETPLMMKGTPEGSREYVVPSRLEPGTFYVLPQSPQQFKLSGTSKSPVACATRIPAATASRNSPSSTLKCRLSSRRMCFPIPKRCSSSL